jgi:alkanesulfonate monooxygenase SsuD/methylene tetrahydromethanopterin reductase-like flavin-dependent oxidoreductase (luciferase family)
MGESASITELEPFDRSFDEKRAVWEDAVRAVIPMFKDGGCEYHGTYFDFPLRNVVPKPLQKPRCGLRARRSTRSRWPGAAASARSPSSS